MKKVYSTIASVVVLLAATLSLTSCAPTKVDMAAVTSVIDVRSVAEFNAGHLEGALNIDVESLTFTDQIETLDHAGTYLVYCHSGRRAGLALDQMHQLGFENVTNIGGLSDAASTTGLQVVAG
jgi:rhodanese-related sulfurtransferase